ncbi:MAG: hypothetical protein IPK79_02640 [Vampirovibrionales bacterium]|nr:hypothetical protein [Vampirovibrionales bacterium]
MAAAIEYSAALFERPRAGNLRLAPQNVVTKRRARSQAGRPSLRVIQGRRSRWPMALRAALALAIVLAPHLL